MEGMRMREKVWNSVRIAAWLSVFMVCLVAVTVLIAAAFVPYMLYGTACDVYSFVAGKPYAPDGDDGWHFRM